MKIQQSFYISAAASLLTSLPYHSAFQPSSSTRNIGYRGGDGTRDYRDYQHQGRRFTSSSSSSLLQLGSTTPTSTSFESIEEKKKADTTTTYKKEVQQQSSSSSNSNNEHVAEGEVLSISFSKSSCSGSEGRSKFAVVKLCQEDLLIQQLPSTLSSSGLVGDSVPLVGSGSGEGEEEEKVELANALFGGGQDQRRAVNMKKTKKKEGSLGTFFFV